MDNAGGFKSMDVDHHCPRGKWRHLYKNLIVATRHCNGAKSDTWPTAAQVRTGVYIINPYEEQDYGKHLFEDPITHEIVAVTPAGFYHINVLDLNAPHLIKERIKRARIATKLSSAGLIVGSLAKFRGLVEELKDSKESYIPDIPPPPLGAEIFPIGAPPIV